MKFNFPELLFFAPFWLSLFGPAVAEPVSINRGAGLGFVFNDAGNCYVVLPEHVHGRQRRLSLLTAAPSAVGDAEIFRSFTPGTDLSIGYVKSGLEDRCLQRWDELAARTDALLDRSDKAILVRVLPSGVEDKVPMIIRSRDLDVVTAAPEDASRGAEIYQGTSGGVLKMGDTIIGMAVRSTSPSEATFLRIDKIRQELERLLEARSPGSPQAELDSGKGQGMATCASAIAIRSAVCDREPVAPEFGCSNMSSGIGRMVLTEGAEPLEMLIELDVDKPVPVAEVRMQKSPEDTSTATPKSLLIEVDSSTGTARRWREFGSMDMSPLGEATVANGARPFARRLRITIEFHLGAEPARPTGLPGRRISERYSISGRRAGTDTSARELRKLPCRAPLPSRVSSPVAPAQPASEADTPVSVTAQLGEPANRQHRTFSSKGCSVKE